MAEILPQNKITEAKAWLHDVFVWGGLASTPKRTVSIEKYRYMYGTHADNFRNDPKDPTAKKYREAAKTICSCIRHRQAETQRFLAFDDAIKLISQCHFIPDLSAARGNIRETPETLCAFIAWFCSENKLVYDNKNTSVEEMKQIKATTIGKVLWDSFLYAKDATPEMRPDNTTIKTTGPVDVGQNATTPTPQSGTAQPTTVKTGGAAGHTLFRSNAGGILTTGKLTDISNTKYVYWIGGEFVNVGKTEPKLHVKPQYAATPLRVDFGSGQGYNDCILYFASESDARNFMGIADAHRPSNVKSLRLKKIGEDPNGYVEVETEFGNAYIKAKKLHEEAEETKEDLTKNDAAEIGALNKKFAEAIEEKGFFRD